MKKFKRIIWLQSIFSEEYVEKSLAVSPAANIWQYRFIKSLSKLQIKLFSVGHNFEPAFPKGKLFVKTIKRNLVKDIKNVSFNYINLPYLRELFLTKRYYNFLKNFKFKKGDIILTYNDSFLSNVTFKIQKELNIPWISIIADLKTPNKASGYVYLNWEYYKKNTNIKKKIHIDGGSYLDTSKYFTKDKNKNEKKIILYAGTIGGHAGLSHLIKAFNLVKNNQTELWICGKGNYNDIKQSIDKDKRIKFLGYVTKKRLEKLCDAADIFVNPRISHGNKTNFPSKILFYLSFNKPIISTKSGLSPKYDNVLFLLDDEKISTLKKKIELLLSLSLHEKRFLKNKIINFNKKNSWESHAKKFIFWLNKNI